MHRELEVSHFLSLELKTTKGFPHQVKLHVWVVGITEVGVLLLRVS